MVKDQITKDNYSLINGDCIEAMADIPNEFIHLSLYSPPFAAFMYIQVLIGIYQTAMGMMTFSSIMNLLSKNFTG